jgi:rhodanese-related sulfurtransferase
MTSNRLRTGLPTWALAAALALAAPAVASAQYLVLGADDVKGWMSGKRKAVIVDTRLPEEWREAHLPGAINLPAQRARAEAAQKLPRDKSTPLIFYCRGTGCTLSKETAVVADALGYTHLMIYQAGIPDWLVRGYPVEKGPAGATPGKSH